MADVVINTPKWMGRPIVDESHAQDLERRAAVNEFGEARMPRHLAEERAFDDYVRERRREAAAHHLAGMKLASMAGDQEAARKHSVMYTMHLKALGHDPMGPVPPEVQRRADSQEKHQGYHFKAHLGDFYAIPATPHQPAQEPLGKAELADRLRTIYTAAKTILEADRALLEKGERCDCPAYGFPHRRTDRCKPEMRKRELTPGERLVRKAGTCKCEKYPFPHRKGGGRCK